MVDVAKADPAREQVDATPDLQALTPDDIARLDYVDFIALIQETNRCPGGLPSLRRQAIASGIDSSTDVLEIGSNTGFTSLELVKMTRCRIVGIDTNVAAVAEARRRRALLPSDLRERVRFEVGDARRIGLASGSVDVIVCGGANTFVEGREKAFAEYARVLRPLGRVTVTNFFYRRAPSASLQQRLRETIGIDIPAWDERQWLQSILNGSPWDVVAFERHRVVPRRQVVVDAYVNAMIDRPALVALRADTREAVRERWRGLCALFNENAAHLGFFELVLRRPLPGCEEQPALFLSPGEYDRWFEHGIVSDPDAEA